MQGNALPSCLRSHLRHQAEQDQRCLFFAALKAFVLGPGVGPYFLFLGSGSYDPLKTKKGHPFFIVELTPIQARCVGRRLCLTWGGH